MSVNSALRAGVTGLSANATAIAVIADNIANVNTTGFKRGSSNFAALINPGSGRGAYNAGGVIASSRQQVDLQGALQQTSNATDLALSGAGFFIVTDNPTATGAATGGLFTRSGSFSLDRDGRLVNSQGYYLLGARMDPNEVDNDVAPASIAALRTIDLSDVGTRATATTQLAITANLNSQQTPVTLNAVPASGSLASIPPNAATPVALERTVEVYDSLGTVRTLTISFSRVNLGDDDTGATPPGPDGPFEPDNQANTWYAEVFWRPGPDQPGIVLNRGMVWFDTNGAVRTDAIAGIAPGLMLPDTITANWATDPAILAANGGIPTGANNQTINFDFRTALTQFAAPSALAAATADGSPPGDLVAVSVDRDGILTALYSNGRSEPLYRIPIATFLNPNALRVETGGVYRQTVDSGLLTINTPGQGGAGVVESNALENSNVDLGAEFTNMITTQRAYSAASRIISTADEMLQELLQIAR